MGNFVAGLRDKIAPSAIKGAMPILTATTPTVAAIERPMDDRRHTCHILADQGAPLVRLHG